MPFGCRNAPATFSRLVKKVLCGLEEFADAYLDDIIIFSNSWDEHLHHLNLVLNKIGRAGLTLKLSKCEFANAQIDYLGHRVGLGQVQPLQHKITSIQNFPRPNTRKQLQSFLGVCGYFRKFLPHYAHLSIALTNLLKKNVKFHWTVEAENAFIDIKSRLASRPILKTPDFTRPFSVAVDASDQAIGAVLFQVHENIEHPVCYYSRKLNIHERRYATVEKEALALVSAVRTFSVYFGTQKTVIYSDHSPLMFIHKMGRHNAKLLRWSLELQQYSLEIKHRPGKDNLLPDILSRPSE